MLDQDQCYVAVQSRDRRFDGWFVTAVHTTGIYCRPSCPAITPRRKNVEFFPTAATAQQRGFRACKRCRPDASPGSPEWNVRHDVVGRAMRLIADGIVDREGVAGLAGRLGYSERHLNRLITSELGAGPLAIARAQRAETARLLVETTAMPLADVAFAAGFGSIRQFNDTFRAVYATAPRDHRRIADGPDTHHPAAWSVPVRLAYRAPLAAPELFAFLAARAIPGVEIADAARYVRTLRLPGGDGVVELQPASDPAGDHIAARFWLTSWSDLAAAVRRTRRLLDLDADPAAVDDALGRHPVLGPFVRAVPGRRAPASGDPFEYAVRAVIGQQVSVAGARRVTGTLVDAVGTPVHVGPHDRLDDGLLRFPDPAAVAAAPDSAFPMPAARRDTIRRVAAAIADGSLVLDAGVDPDTARAQLLALRGIGPWTADYIVMRGLAHPDTFLGTDLGVRHALERLGVDDPDGIAFAPWRSYAVHHLWASLAQPLSAKEPR